MSDTPSIKHLIVKKKSTTKDFLEVESRAFTKGLAKHASTERDWTSTLAWGLNHFHLVIQYYVDEDHLARLKGEIIQLEVLSERSFIFIQAPISPS